MKSVMTHQYAQVPRADIPRSSFDRSHGYKTTFDGGYLVPFFVDEALPGDTFSLHATTFARLATPMHPIMDNLFADVFYFAVPIRLIWDHFPNFFGEQKNPSDSTSFLVPQFSPHTVTMGMLSDYMGIPINVTNLVYNSLHHRAYNLIWNEWFRDENLQNSVTVDKGDGPDNISNYVLLRRGKRHDYFTSCLPWPQKGVAVSIPLGTTAPVKTQLTDSMTGAQTALLMRNSATGAAPASPAGLSVGTDRAVYGGTASPTASYGLYPSNLYADLSTATAATINSLRQAFQIQKIYERDARGGTRYTELIQSHFGVTSPDGRLNRPEYLGGGSAPIQVNPVAQTSPAPPDMLSPTPQGNLAAIGTFSHSGAGFTKSFTEHCVLIGLINVRADLTYQQGISRMFSRQTRFDFYWPALAQIGEQAVLRKEIYANGGVNDNDVWGYQERYAEYRSKPSLITGAFRSAYGQPLDSWHLSINFASPPSLNAAFIVDNPPISRVIAVPTQPHFILDVFFNLRCARPMPVYGVPGNIDRF